MCCVLSVLCFAELAGVVKSIFFPTMPSSLNIPLHIPKVSFTKAKLALDFRKGLLFQEVESVHDNITIIEDFEKTKDDDEELSLKENGSSQTKIFEAAARDVYRVICDIENYNAWGGTGIVGTKVLSVAAPQKDQLRSIITEIRCGAFGFSFKMNVISFFETPQRNNGTKTPYTVSFKLMKKVPFVDVFEGQYFLTPLRNQTNAMQDISTEKIPESTSLTFESMVKFSGPIPGFVQTGIKNLVNDIAVKELGKYCQGGSESRMCHDFAQRPVVDWCEIGSKYGRFSNRFKAATPNIPMMFKNFKTWTNPGFVLRWMHVNVYRISTDIRQSILNFSNVSNHLVLVPKEIDVATSSSRRKKSIHQTTLFFLLVQNLLFFPKLLFERNNYKGKPPIRDSYQNLLTMANNGDAFNHGAIENEDSVDVDNDDVKSRAEANDSKEWNGFRNPKHVRQVGELTMHQYTLGGDE